MLIGIQELLLCLTTDFKKLTAPTFLDQEMLADHQVTADNQPVDLQVDRNHLDQDQFMDHLKDPHQKLFPNGFVEQPEKIIENKIKLLSVLFCSYLNG